MLKLIKITLFTAYCFFLLLDLSFAEDEDSDLISSCENPYEWHVGGSGGSKITLAVDKEDSVDGGGSIVIRYDLQPGKKGVYSFCNIPICESRRNWSKAKSISFYLKGDGSSNKIKIGLKDKESELFLSKKTFKTKDKNWRKYEINLNKQGFCSSEDYQPDSYSLKNPGNLDLEKIQEFQIHVQDFWTKKRKGSLKLDKISLSTEKAKSGKQRFIPDKK